MVLHYAYYVMVLYGIECYSMVFNHIGGNSMVFDEAKRNTQEVPKSNQNYL